MVEGASTCQVFQNYCLSGKEGVSTHRLVATANVNSDELVNHRDERRLSANGPGLLLFPDYIFIFPAWIIDTVNSN
jgi:hypothetical protein